MTTTVQAIYENGKLVLPGPLPLPEKSHVTVTIDSPGSPAAGGNAVYHELKTMADGCRTANWDGHGAAPISEQTYGIAQRFLEALPPGVTPSTVGAEPDGYFTLEWHRFARRTLSVSVSQSGELHYAALLGASKAYGTEPFSTLVPAPILAIINRVVSA